MTQKQGWTYTEIPEGYGKRLRKLCLGYKTIRNGKIVILIRHQIKKQRFQLIIGRVIIITTIIIKSVRILLMKNLCTITKCSDSFVKYSFGKIINNQI